ncbi:hypothetical protein N9Z67_03040, partial [Rhodopirellula sp.]|nr:hypothetical protein [Rhodopirellula sp.]
MKGVDQKLLMELPDFGTRGPVAVRVVIVAPVNRGRHQVAIQLGTTDKRPSLLRGYLAKCFSHLSIGENVDA